MATHFAIAATSKTIERLLTACFAVDQPVDNKQTRAVLARTDDFDTTKQTSAIAQRIPALSVFLYRVEPNATTRAAWSAVGSQDGQSHLPLDLHYLLTPWAANAEHEHRILGSALACMDTTPIAQGPLLHPAGGWGPADAVQFTIEDLAGDALTRTFESLQADFRVSVSLLARVIRLDTPVRTAGPVATAVLGIRPDVDEEPGP